MRVSFFSGLSMVAMAFFTAQGTQAIHINDSRYGIDDNLDLAEIDEMDDVPMAATQTNTDIDADADADAEFFDALK